MAEGIQRLAVHGFVALFVAKSEGFFRQVVMVVHLFLDFCQVPTVEESYGQGGEIAEDHALKGKDHGSQNITGYRGRRPSEGGDEPGVEEQEKGCD
ncbi:hypothetical protein DAMNIGENAA_00260 [Desulforhabdus amnigena]|uniref:Uncharacterized protein n=1 Tax=Desulforhabdus amnigena TaxID=40218 RepID=A0A9W6CZM3_9BACT|nr:hypothetical protein DAMNIGENAA_00260 [Desulforhabdus amnigena]